MALSEASKTKVAYQAATATGTSILTAMMQDPSREWADERTRLGSQGPLKTAMSKLNAACTDFARKFLVING